MPKITQYTYLGPFQKAIKAKGYTVETFAKRIASTKKSLMAFMVGKSKKIGSLVCRDLAAEILELAQPELQVLMQAQEKFKDGRAIGVPLLDLQLQFVKYFISIKPDQLPPVDLLMNAGVTRARLNSVGRFVGLLLELMPEGPGPDEVPLKKLIEGIASAVKEDESDSSDAPPATSKPPLLILKKKKKKKITLV